MTEQTMTWEQMVHNFPAMWVVVRNAVMDGPDIVSGIVEDVKPDDEIIDYRSRHLHQGYVFRRTTEEALSGIVN